MIPRRLTSLALVKMFSSKSGCYGNGGCPGLYENALDEGVRGQENIMDINDMPTCKQPEPSAPCSLRASGLCLFGLLLPRTAVASLAQTT